jgi:hypothetical protein
MLDEAPENLGAREERLSMSMKVANDDSADITQPKLTRHFCRRLEVRLQNGFLGILLSGVAGRSSRQSRTSASSAR